MKISNIRFYHRIITKECINTLYEGARMIDRTAKLLYQRKKCVYLHYEIIWSIVEQVLFFKVIMSESIMRLDVLKYRMCANVSLKSYIA